MMRSRASRLASDIRYLYLSSLGAELMFSRWDFSASRKLFKIDLNSADAHMLRHGAPLNGGWATLTKQDDVNSM
eukprot:2333733-Pyramimonas_sp.AAC.1